MKIIFTSILLIAFAFLLTNCIKKQDSPVLPVDYSRHDTITYSFYKNTRSQNNVDSFYITMSMVKYSLLTYQNVGVDFDTSFTMLVKDFPDNYQFKKPFYLKNINEESYKIGLGFKIKNKHVSSFGGSSIGNKPKPMMTLIIFD